MLLFSLNTLFTMIQKMETSKTYNEELNIASYEINMEELTIFFLAVKFINYISLLQNVCFLCRVIIHKYLIDSFVRVINY